MQAVQDIKLGEIDASVAVNGVRVFGNDQVKPSTAAFSTSGDTPFSTYTLQMLSDLLFPISFDSSV